VTPLFGWLRDRRRQREQHAAAWAQEAGPDGLKPFQLAARERVDRILTTLGAPIQWSIEQLGQESGPSLIGRAPSIFLVVEIDDDTFSFTVRDKGDYLEWWDYLTPAAMIDEFVSRVRANTRSPEHRARDA